MISDGEERNVRLGQGGDVLGVEGMEGCGGSLKFHPFRCRRASVLQLCMLLLHIYG